MIYFTIYILIGFLLASLMMWELEALISQNEMQDDDISKPAELHLIQLIVTIFKGYVSTKPITQEYSIILPLFILCGFLWPIIIIFISMLAIKIIFNTLFQ